MAKYKIAVHGSNDGQAEYAEVSGAKVRIMAGDKVYDCFIHGPRSKLALSHLSSGMRIGYIQGFLAAANGDKKIAAQLFMNYAIEHNGKGRIQSTLDNAPLIPKEVK